jgi:hypothetical protein
VISEWPSLATHRESLIAIHSATALRGEHHHANLQAELHAKLHREKVCAKLDKLIKLEELEVLAEVVSGRR